MTNLDLTVLMPCLNEEKSLPFCINEIQETLDNIPGLLYEIVVADNGSTDNSVAVAKQNGAKVINVSTRGYGAALIAGINDAKGKYVVMGDSDGSYDFTHIPRFLSKLSSGFDLVVGNRYAGGIDRGAMKFSHRYIGVPILSALARLRYGVKIGDFHCGLRGFDAQKARELNLSCPGMEFATEIIGKFAKAGCHICEIPTTLRPDKRKGKAHLRTIRDGLRHVRYILLGQ